MRCRSSECGNEVENVVFGYCEECRVLVWAYESSEGEPQFIAHHDPTASAETEIEAGVEHMGEQCDGCGNSRYVVKAYASATTLACFAAVCSAMEVDGEHFPGCGSEYPIILRRTHEVIF